MTKTTHMVRVGYEQSDGNFVDSLLSEAGEVLDFYCKSDADLVAQHLANNVEHTSSWTIWVDQMEGVFDKTPKVLWARVVTATEEVPE